MKIDLAKLNENLESEIFVGLFNRCNEVLEKRLNELYDEYYNENYPSDDDTYDEYGFESVYDEYEYNMEDLRIKIDEYIEEQTNEEALQVFAQDSFDGEIEIDGDEIDTDLIVEVLFKEYSYEEISKEEAEDKFYELTN